MWIHFALLRTQKGKLPHSSDMAECPVCKESENGKGSDANTSGEDVVILFA